MSKLLNELNPAQRKAVTHKYGPLLIIAGPGSGKTRTIACSIAYAIGNLEVDPSKIAAFTFTNKAKDELKNRVGDFVVEQDIVDNVWISTFHSFCGHVWNNHPGKLIIEKNERDFTAEELTRVYKMRYQIDRLQHHKFVDDKEILNTIKQWEKQDISPAGISDQEVPRICVEVYKKYKQILEEKDKDILEDSSDIFTKIQLFTNALLRDAPEVRTKWQEKFELIFVDEFQDTDPIQYEIIRALAGEHPNLRVVGDDDQSIYGWRGADIQNILNFENDYSIGKKPITLGQNYRSTRRIVEASRALAEFNPDHREKDLFTGKSKDTDPKVINLHCEDANVEANTIANFIARSIKGDREPRDFTILCRSTKSQSPIFEEAFKNSGIPLHVVEDLSDIPTNKVSIMTIHKSKGLEFPNVFVAGVCSGLLPHYNSKEEDWSEELRLLYVAMTRAKNWLCLSSYEVDTKHKRGRSPFLKYIPKSLLESVKTLENTSIPPHPKEMKTTGSEEPPGYEPLPEKLLGSGMTVIGVDPGNIGAHETNVGWSVTQKVSGGYSVLDHNTEHPIGNKEDKLEKIKHTINRLVDLYRPDAIAVEKLEVATRKAKEDWFLYVAGCVAAISTIADQRGIECRRYTPQEVKYAATGDKQANKEQVEQGVQKRSNLRKAIKTDHEADAIAVSLCYLRSHLNSSRFEGNKRKQEYYKAGYDYSNMGQYETAAAKFKKAIDIDPIYADAHYGLGRAYFGQGNLIESENSANKTLRLEPNCQLALALLEDIKQTYCKRGFAYIEDSEYTKAINPLLKASDIAPNDKEVWTNLGRAYYWIDDYAKAATCYQKATDIDPNDKTVHTNLGNAYYWMSEYQTAINLFRKAINIDQNCAKTRDYLKRARSKLNKKVKHVHGAPVGMTPIFEGTFQIKHNDNAAWNDKKSMRSVHIDSFYIDTHEVTNAEYKKFLNANPQWSKNLISREYHDGSYLKRWYENTYPNGEDYHPVAYVSWYAAMAYAQWVGKRLPTEAEWEKASRMGSYQMSGYRYNMNAWEWCLDEYRLDFYENYPRPNPIVGADSTNEIINNFINVKTPRVLRGGNWGNGGQFMRAAKRYSKLPTFTSLTIGFRCVTSVID